MRQLNDLSLEEFTETLKYLDKLFTGPVEEFALLLDHANTECRLAGELSLALKELMHSELDESLEKATEHYKVIVALWLLLNEPGMLQGKAVKEDSSMRTP